MKSSGKTCELSVFGADGYELGYVNLYEHATSVERLMEVMDEVGIPRKTEEQLQEMYAEQAHEEYLWHLKKEAALADARRRYEANQAAGVYDNKAEALEDGTGGEENKEEAAATSTEDATRSEL